MTDLKTLEELKKIPDKKWGQIYKELVWFADFKLTQGGFQIRTEKDSVNAEHFAAVAIERVFDGTRAWDAERFPDITIHLKGIVKSLISSHFKSSSRSKIKVGAEVEATASSDRITEEYQENEEFENYGLIDESPEEVCISEEKWTAIEAAFGQDTEGHLIFCEWLDGNQPRDISDILEIEVSRIYSVIKKGKQIVKRIYAHDK